MSDKIKGCRIEAARDGGFVVEETNYQAPGQASAVLFAGDLDAALAYIRKAMGSEPSEAPDGRTWDPDRYPDPPPLDAPTKRRYTRHTP